MMMAGFRGTYAALCASVICFCLLSDGNAKGHRSSRVRTDFGYVSVDPRDVDAAIGEGKAVQAAARQVLLLYDVPLAIVEDGRGHGRWGVSADGYVVYPWFFPHGSRQLDERPAVHVLRHEIGHDLFQRLVPRSRANQYGTDAPDWLDEMAAIAFEAPGNQAQRRRAARREADGGGLIPLSRLLAMEHPEFSAQSSAAPGLVVMGAAPTSHDTIRFYSTVQAFYDFLRTRSGSDAIVAELAAAFGRGDDLGTWILKRVRHDDRQRSLEQLDAEFRNWIVEDPRFAA